MAKGRVVAIVALVMCVVLAVSLAGVTVGFSSTLNQKTTQVNELKSTIDSKDAQISDLQKQVANDTATVQSLNATITDLQSQLLSTNAQITSLTSQTAGLQNQVNDLASRLNSTQTSEVTNLIFHVCEKGQGYTWGHIPNATYTYSQILTLTDGKYNVLLLPEFEGDGNWEEAFTWLKQNFVGIPIVLSVFEGGSGSIPNRQLTLEQISEAVAALNVKELRIGEMASWYLAHLMPFPTNYTSSLLNFTRAHALKLEWSEWQVNYGAFQRIQGYIKGYEDIATVTFQTNSKELEPFDGFLLASEMFPHWGGSIQSWYWEERGYGSTFDMPTSVLLEHTLAARKLGAEILEFEPYWYLFDNGIPRDNFQELMAVLTSI